MMKIPYQYRALEKSESVPNPIQLDAKSLNEARLEVRRQLTLIARETARLVIEPEKADLDAEDNLRPVPYQWPAILAARMPVSPR